MENIFFLILIAVVGLVRWLSQMAENKRNADAERQAGSPAAGGGTAPPVQRPPAQTEEERIRRFMEALGVPTSSPPPPPVQPRPATPQAPPPQRQFLPVDPFPIPRAQRAEAPPPPAVPTTPAIPAAPPPLPPPPLPTRETSVFAKPAPRHPARVSTTPEFEVQDVAADAREDAGTEARAPKDRHAPAVTSQSRGGIAARLASPQALRDAVILREIFGPPRSMQPIDAR